MKIICDRKHISPKTPCISVKVKVKGKGCPVTCQWKAQRESRGLLIVNLGARLGWVVSAVTWLLFAP
jgi:hypothetical protein